MSTSPEPVVLPGEDEQSTAASDRLVQGALARALPDAAPEHRRVIEGVIAPWARTLVRWLDEAIRIPGTKITIGLDPILGFLLPGVGDAATGVGSLALLFLALKQRVPTVVLLRMLLNIIIDTVGGLLPIVGDVFDVLWRSNRMNLALIERYRNDPEAEPTAADYLIVGLGILFVVASVVLPLVILWALGLSAIVALGKLFGR